MSISFLSNGNLSSTGSHIRLNEFKNKQMAVSETGIDLLFHCVCRFFLNVSIFNDLKKNANVTI